MKNIGYLLAILLLAFACVVSSNAQMCGTWDVIVTVVDKEHRGILNASVQFIGVQDEDDAAFDRAFNSFMPDSNVYAARFSEGEKVARNGQTYNVLISAPGYRDLTSTVKIDYCRRTNQTRVLEVAKK
jgi:hypothetical protein